MRGYGAYLTQDVTVCDDISRYILNLHKKGAKMARNPTADNARSVLLSLALQNANWNVDPYGAGTIQDWTDRYPLVPIVADGRPCLEHRKEGVTTPNDKRALKCPDCFVAKGRGTTLIDLSRNNGWRSDFLSIKTGKIGNDDKLPSRIDLGTGNEETIAAIVDAAMRGSSIPVVFWVSGSDMGGDPMHDGYAVFIDVAPFIREYGAVPIATKPYARGKAPPCYVALSSRRICGVPGGNRVAADAVLAFETQDRPLPPGKWYTRSQGFEPGFDEKGRYWSKPYAVHYSELRISLSACGIKRENWIPCKLSQVPELIERQDWNQLSLG